MCRLLQISCPFCRMGPIDATPRAIYVTRHSCNTCRISDAYLQHRGLVFAFLLPCLAAGGPALRERESAWKSEKDQSAISSFFTCADPFPHSKNHTQVHKLLNSSTLNLCESDSETESMHTHTHMYTRVLKHTHMHTHTLMHMHMHTHTHTQTKTHMHVHAHRIAYNHTYIQSHTAHAHTITDNHTCTQSHRAHAHNRPLTLTHSCTHTHKHTKHTKRNIYMHIRTQHRKRKTACKFKN